MTFYNIIFRVSLLMIVLLFVADLAMGQPGLPSSPSQAPIDGGLGFLAAGGVAYAVNKLRKRNSAE